MSWLPYVGNLLSISVSYCAAGPSFTHLTLFSTIPLQPVCSLL